MSQQDLTQMKTGEVAERARQASVRNVEQMDKDEMIRAMNALSQSKKPGHGGGRGDDPKPKGTGPEQWKNVPGNQT